MTQKKKQKKEKPLPLKTIQIPVVPIYEVIACEKCNGNYSRMIPGTIENYHDTRRAEFDCHVCGHNKVLEEKDWPGVYFHVCCNIEPTILDLKLSRF